MDSAKVQVIQNWPEPRKVKNIQSFLGFANFYHRFIHEYSDIVITLTQLIWKDLEWNFSNACHDTFNNLKPAFTSAPVLTHWIPDAPMIVKTDASNYAIATIFSIILPNGEIHPVAFHSCTLTTSELNYDTHDKELLAIFKAFQKWQHYSVHHVLGTTHLLGTVHIVTSKHIQSLRKKIIYVLIYIEHSSDYSQDL